MKLTATYNHAAERKKLIKKTYEQYFRDLQNTHPVLFERFTNRYS